MEGAEAMPRWPPVVKQGKVMNKLTIGAVALLLAGGAAAAAFPWYLGVKTEQKIVAALASDVTGGAGSPVSVTLVQYRRGWLHSSAIHRIALKADPEVHFDVNHAIRHVPDPGKGFVVIQSTPQWPQKVQAAADYYFGGKPAFSVQTVVRFDRSMGVSVESPAFSKPMLAQPEVKLSWGGATGTMSVAGGNKTAMELTMPGVAVEGGGVVGEFAGMQVKGDWVIAGNQADWSGRTDLGIREMSVSSPFGSGSLKGLQITGVQRNQGKTVQLGYTLKVAEGTAEGPGEGPKSFKNAVLDVEVDRLDKQALAKYFDDMAGADQAELAPDAHNRLVTHIAVGMFGDLLKGSPEVRVKQVAVQMEDGQISGSAVLNFNGEGFAAQGQEQPSSAELMSRLTLSASAELSSSLVQAWMAGGAREQALSALTAQGATFEEAQLRSLAEEMVRQQLAALEATGLLKVEGDKFVARAELASGALTINGVRSDHFLPVLGPQPAALEGTDQDA
jgi:uncharacterized protein YdgA (DUF945 family)